MTLDRPLLLKEKIIYYNCLIDQLYEMEGLLKTAKTDQLKHLMDKTLALSILKNDLITQQSILLAKKLGDNERSALLREIKACQKNAVSSAAAALEARHNDYIYVEAI